MSVAEKCLPDRRPPRQPVGSNATSPTITETRQKSLVQQSIAWAWACLEELQNYGRNWDGYDADPPSEDAISTAATLLSYLRLQFSMTAPEVNPIRDGSVSLEWKLGSKSLELEVEKSFSGSFLYKDPETNSRTPGEIFDLGGSTTPGFDWAVKMMFA